MASPELHAKDDSPLRLPVWGVDSIFGISETSSSDGFSTSFGSELGSTGTETESEDGGGGEDDDDFIAELARQMADYMLQDEDESFEDDNGVQVPPEYSPKFMQVTENRSSSPIYSLCWFSLLNRREILFCSLADADTKENGAIAMRARCVIMITRSCWNRTL